MGTTIDNGIGGQSAYAVVGVETPEAGCISWWRLSGDVDLDRLRAEWESRGLPPELLPEATSAQVALRRAVRELADGRTLIRPLEHRQGWAVVRERANGDALSYEQGLVVKLGPGDAPAFVPADHPAVPEVRAHFDRQLGTVTQGDAGGWLSWLMGKLDAVALRDTGGVYFVPRHTLPVWRQIIAAVRAATGHAVLGVPAMPVAETVAAVLDAVTAEALGECETIERQVAEAELGERALETRMQRAGAVEAKLARYEALVGTKLDDVRDRLERLRAGITSALLVAQTDMGVAS